MVKKVIELIEQEKSEFKFNFVSKTLADFTCRNIKIEFLLKESAYCGTLEEDLILSVSLLYCGKNIYLNKENALELVRIFTTPNISKDLIAKMKKELLTLKD